MLCGSCHWICPVGEKFDNIFFFEFIERNIRILVELCVCEAFEWTSSFWTFFCQFAVTIYGKPECMWTGAFDIDIQLEIFITFFSVVNAAPQSYHKRHLNLINVSCALGRLVKEKVNIFFILFRFFLVIQDLLRFFGAFHLHKTAVSAWLICRMQITLMTNWMNEILRSNVSKWRMLQSPEPFHHRAFFAFCFTWPADRFETENGNYANKSITISLSVILLIVYFSLIGKVTTWNMN